jgi:CRISPR-associated endonuclease/helicase Cas3
LGKTSVVAIWLIALANHPEKLPRRLVYVVNRRTVVDQTTNEVEKLRANLRASGLFTPLSRLCALPLRDDVPLAISTLRGQFADNREWSADPSRPAVIVGTVDMIGSRLLFSGYGVGFKGRPLHAGFLGQDVLLVHDEAHLEPAFHKLLIAIEKEQQRSGEFAKLNVMSLSATSRSQEKPFELTEAERDPPKDIPDPPTESLHVVWRRLKAKKAIRFHAAKRDDVAKQIGLLARQRKASGKAVLAFVRTIDDLQVVQRVLTDKKEGVSEDQVQVLTGTLRGLERDRLVQEDPIFARLLLKAPANDRTVYLICTAAGEVGIDISADHMVCDLTPLDSITQRLGRVNRRGEGAAEIDLVYERDPDEKREDKEVEKARWNTLEILRRLSPCAWIEGRQDASALALRNLDLSTEERRAAFTPEPPTLPTSDILFDCWALTTIRGKLPGRPPVEPYLHGVEDEKRAETRVAWRHEVWELRDTLEDQRQLARLAADLLEDYPLKPHELLRDSTFRKNTGVRDALARLAVQSGKDLPVWIQEPDDTVIVTTLETLAELSLVGRTVLLPPRAGGLKIVDDRSLGLFDGDARFQREHQDLYDVADDWWGENGERRRIRVWQDDPQFGEKTKGMRLIRTIDTNPEAEEEEEGDATGRRFWHWYELPRTGDNDGSKAAKGAVEWQVHTDDVLCNTKSIVEHLPHLPLSEELRNALIVAAKSHDLGKKRKRFQRILGNVDGGMLLAKSGKKQARGLKEDYRHEFGSLLDVEAEAEFEGLSEEMKDLVLHLIAAHHGRGRPHFPIEEAFDPEPNGKDISAIASEVPRRFARLQRKYGRWGLAHLESLLRAADYAASANPSAVLEED